MQMSCSAAALVPRECELILAPLSLASMNYHKTG
jgi:hypothetical protein